MVNLVGFRLSPTEDEMVGCHLHCKLMRKALLANNFINEIKIYNYDPWMLRFESNLKSRDSVWYFFTPVENDCANGDRQKRSTSSGFWKITGKPKAVYDRWGFWSGNRDVIGFKRVLRFHFGTTVNEGNGDWIMHEYHNTMLPLNLRTHVMCRVEYKGGDISFVSDNSTEICPDFVHHLMNNAASVVNHTVQGGSMYVSVDENQDLNGDEMQVGLESLLGEESMADESMVCRGGSEDFNNQEELPSLISNEEETQMLFNSTSEDLESMWNESMVLGNSSSFGESKYYLNELCFNSPLNSPEFTYEPSIYGGTST